MILNFGEKWRDEEALFLKHFLLPHNQYLPSDLCCVVSKQAKIRKCVFHLLN